VIAMPLEVLVNARHLTGPRTGIEVYMETLLAALGRTGLVHLTALTWAPIGLSAPGVTESIPARRPELRPGSIQATLWKLWFDQWACLRGRRHPLLFHGMDGFLPYRLRRRDRAVCTVHDLGWQAYPELYQPRLRLMYQALFPWVVRRADRVIAVSRHTADDLVRRAGMSAARIDVVHHGLDPSFLRDGGAPAADEHPYFLAVGGVSPRKNTRRLIEAFTRWRGRGGPRAHHRLLITGTSLDPELGAPGAALPDGVSLLGYVSKDELIGLYAGAAGFLYPSVYEGFGLPILEAMAAGAPVLTSTTGSAPEVAAGAAILVDPFDVDAIALGLERMTHPAEAERLRALGRIRAREFTWERAAAETVEVYRRLG
jgi:glycosyltransferase involved in cell wall biosynthesis